MKINQPIGWSGRVRVPVVMIAVAILCVLWVGRPWLARQYLLRRIHAEKDVVRKVVLINSIPAPPGEDWDEFYLQLCREADAGSVRHALAQILLDRLGTRARSELGLEQESNLSPRQTRNLKAVETIAQAIETGE